MTGGVTQNINVIESPWIGVKKFNAYTRVKTHKLLQVCKQVVTSLFTSCQQVVFALLAPSLL